MTHIITYILLGVLWNLCYDILISNLPYVNQDPEDLRFNMLERFTMLITWPIAVTYFIIGLIKLYLSRNKDK